MNWIMMKNLNHIMMNERIIHFEENVLTKNTHIIKLIALGEKEKIKEVLQNLIIDIDNSPEKYIGITKDY
jgi:hypothetical protein